MTDSLTIAVAQPETRLGDVEFNVARHASIIAASQARVVVFPELSLTGYSMDAPTIDPGDPRLAPLIAACREHRSVALVGAAVAMHRGLASDRRAIAMLHIDGGGADVVYRKMFLGGDEPEWFEAGEQPAVVEIDGWRLGLAICKDTGVADHASETAALGIDVYVAGVCETEADRDVPAERAARVIAAHRVPVAVASFAGATGGGFDDTAGRSTIWYADGTVAATTDRTPGQFTVASLSRA